MCTFMIRLVNQYDGSADENNVENDSKFGVYFIFCCCMLLFENDDVVIIILHFIIIFINSKVI